MELDPDLPEVKKNILIITCYIPFPLSLGGNVAQYYFLEHLCHDYNITLLTEAESNEELVNVQELKKRIPRLNVVIKNSISTDPVRHFANGLRGYLRQMRSWSKGKSQISKGHLVNRVTFETARPAFAHFILDHLNRHTYDFLQLEFFGALNLLPLLPSTSKRIFVHHELYYKRLSSGNHVDPALQQYLVDSVKFYEHALLGLADVVVVFNEDDKSLLSESHQNVIVSPFGIPAPLIVKKDASSTFEKFIFLGSEIHHPNKEGLIWFLDTLYVPNYSAMEWPIYVLGVWSNEIKSKYQAYNRIQFTGFVEHLDTVYDGAVMITPIRSGSGIRTKILQAFANKVPVLSTPFAAEGLYANETDNHLLFFSDEKSFLTIYREALQSQTIPQQVALGGYHYFTEHFNDEKLLKMRKVAYDVLF